jgi:ABC-type cobalamin/Fe3+-siderophores transport system ATPase subunit
VEISPHEVRVYRALQDGEWHTSREIAAAAQVADRTARAHARKFVQLGVAEHLETFGGWRFRLTEHHTKQAREYVEQLKRAAEVFEL